MDIEELMAMIAQALEDGQPPPESILDAMRAEASRDMVNEIIAAEKLTGLKVEPGSYVLAVSVAMQGLRSLVDPAEVRRTVKLVETVRSMYVDQVEKG